MNYLTVHLSKYLYSIVWRKSLPFYIHPVDYEHKTSEQEKNRLPFKILALQWVNTWKICDRYNKSRRLNTMRRSFRHEGLVCSDVNITKIVTQQSATFVSLILFILLLVKHQRE